MKSIALTRLLPAEQRGAYRDAGLRRPIEVVARAAPHARARIIVRWQPDGRFPVSGRIIVGQAAPA